MNLSQLLVFVPLIFAVFFVYHLIFKVQLPSKGLGAIISYIFGGVIIFFVIGWLISGFLGPWLYDMVQAGQDEDLQRAVNASEGIIRDAFGADENTTTLQQPVNDDSTTPVIVVTAVPPRDGGVVVGGNGDSGGGTPALTDAVEYTVKSGDTLHSIGRQFGVTLKAIKEANPQISDENIIVVGNKLIIPAPAE